jgi:putative transposase
MFRYPDRVAHRTPTWVESGATYHIRFSIDLKHPVSLTNPNPGETLLDSARFYHERERWACRLFLLMPDHLHALLTFPYDTDMGDIVGAWKGYHDKHHDIHWQENYFDHRIRSRAELEEKAMYIRMNPVRKNLCRNPEDWPWVISCV